MILLQFVVLARSLTLRNRYDPMNLFDLVPQLSREMNPELTQLDRLLEDDVLFVHATSAAGRASSSDF